MENPLDKAIRQYFLSQYQPEWLDAHGFATLSMRELLNDPEVRRTPGLVRALLSPLIETAEYHESERAALKAAQFTNDDTLWAIRYNAKHPPEPALFEDFQYKNNSSLYTAWAAVKRWVYGLGPGLLTLSGPPGVGKTHLAQAAWTYLDRHPRAIDPIWCVEGKLVMDLHAALNTQTLGAILPSFMGAQYVIYDDMGTSAQGDWIRGIFDQFIDTRWMDSNLRTLITTNLGANDLSPRIASRLRDKERAAVVVMDAPDYRVRRAP